MTTLLGLDTDNLKQRKAFWTAKEINQQPLTWLATHALVESQQQQIERFLQPLLDLENLHIVFTGAGTSAYIGDILTPHLTTKLSHNVSSVSTTDIVSHPESYLPTNKPLLLVSFARSGNSPESLAAVSIASQINPQCHHLVITCNKQGELATGCQASDKAFSLILPEETLDNSFAMTSSFSSMIVAALAIFSPDQKQLEHAVNWSSQILHRQLEEINSVAHQDVTRVVFLGAGVFKGFAQEAALKYLELTSGKILSTFESPLGFRHGPKSLVDNQTQIFIFNGSSDYVNQYDRDLYKELVSDGIAPTVKLINAQSLGQTERLDDIWAGLAFIVYAQILSFYKSLQLEISPDNPSPDGTVNRVVQGVTIYPLTR